MGIRTLQDIDQIFRLQISGCQILTRLDTVRELQSFVYRTSLLGQIIFARPDIILFRTEQKRHIDSPTPYQLIPELDIRAIP